VGHVAAAIGREFRGKGANVILGPGVNVHRSPYGGRNFEYLSGEDPYLGSRLAVAYIKAVQGQGVMAVAKHFAFNEQETERDSMNSEVGEHAAWALYYPPFQAAVDAGVGAIMCSYNKVNGTHACSNDRLLRGDLKGKMGFNGFVVSDWYATHHSTAVESGLDMEQPDPKHFNHKSFADADPEAVSQAARRVLASIYRLRLDERPGCELPCKSERQTSQRTPKHLELAGIAAAAGVVLLKNDGILPLHAGSAANLAIIGAAANAQDTLNTWGAGSPYSGGGSGHVAAPTVSTPLNALRERANEAGIHTLNGGSNLDLANRSQVLPFLEEADVVIIVAATTSTEDSDRKTLSLDNGVDELIEEVSKQRPTIVLIEAPGAVLTPWRDKTPAIACMFLGGEETGSGWAKVLFGDVEPSGRLPIVLPAHDWDEIRPSGGSVPYSEGLMTSYRSPRHQSAFPFGHGLSYTKFSFGKPTQTSDNCPGAACIYISIRNVGKRAGSEVVQAYLQFDPRLQEPRMVLRGFQRTHLLQPGENEEVRIVFSRHDLSAYIVGQGWTLQEWAVAHIGASSGDIRQLIPVRAPVPIPLN
jgi:beta-glucosidase